ncbi:MAG: hypothetical protein ABW046_20540 [Actinoplanes sp.]
MLRHLRTRVRAFIGTDTLVLQLSRTNHRIRNLEVRMATGTEQITALSAKFDDFASDVRAALAVINEDKLSPTAQEALDGLSEKLAALDTEVGDADASDSPAEPTEPTGEDPDQL